MLTGYPRVGFLSRETLLPRGRAAQQAWQLPFLGATLWLERLTATFSLALPTINSLIEKTDVCAERKRTGSARGKSVEEHPRSHSMR